MNFTNLYLIVFCLIVLVLYYSCRNQFVQNFTLIISSIAFYGVNQFDMLFLFVFSILFNAVISFHILKKNGCEKKILMYFSILVNISILLVFKYSRLISNGEWSFVLPIGISFYTFQGVSLAFDSYYNKSNVFQSKNLNEHLVKTAMFKSYFPVMISGPILLAHDFFPQITFKKIININLPKSAEYIILGLFFKMFIANNLKDHTYWIQDPFYLIYSSVNLVFMVIGYSIQIFADFAGYSFIALGVSELFGYHLKENFNFPYISQSFSSFWRRWHMSLSSFFKEYLYIPLGGNRKTFFRNLLNVFIVMVIGGLWHGSRLSFLFWGIYHALLLIIEKIICKSKINLPKTLRIIIVFTGVSLGWIFFKLQNFDEFNKFFCALLNNFNIAIIKSNIFYILFYSFPIFVYHCIPLVLKFRKGVMFIEKVRLYVFILMLYLILFASGTDQPFIYFQF